MGSLKRRLEFLSYLLNRTEMACPHEDVDTAADAAEKAPWGPQAGMIRLIDVVLYLNFSKSSIYI
jgi:hypothetical protein